MRPATECPGTDTIAELVCRQLVAAKVVEVEAHVADCAACRQLVGTLAGASLPRLIDASTAGDDPVDARADAAPVPLAGADRYVIQTELARGGMGRISIAEDRLLHRTVAIKELLAPSAALAARFWRELALTARLQHPSIVSIHDGGTWPSGEPFYVMRLVSGEPLDRVIARHDGIAARVGLLPHAIAMVDALAYAHSQGIVHRDLKPANVIVGDFGETIVIDWGLAKDLRDTEIAVDGAARLESAAGYVIGTPAYMAPEQARGEPVDARADVYALGAVLYQLFGGGPPHTGGTASAIVRAARRGSPPPLRAPGLPRDLRTIVDKAMAPRAEDRYATAGELAADLKRFERGQLVGAHHYTSWQLAKRWVRRHRTAVAVASIAAVVVVGIAVASFVRVTAARGVAEHHRADAEELMTFMLTDLHDKLQPLGKLDVLGAVANKALAYERLHPDDPATQRAITLGNLGDVMLAQDNASGALAEYQAALAISATLAAGDPGDLQLQHRLATAHGRVANTLFGQGDIAGALIDARASWTIFRAIADARPDDAGDHADLVLAQLMLGHALEVLGQMPEALAQYRATLPIATTFLGRAPTDLKWQRAFVESHERIASALLKRREHVAALVEARIGVAAAELFASHDPEDADWHRDEFAAHYLMGWAIGSTDPAGELVEFRAALAHAQQLVAHDPSNLEWQGRLSTAHSSIGNALLALGDTPNALVAFRAALASTRVRAARQPANLEVQRQLFRDHSNLADVLATRDNAAAAVEDRAALAIIEVLAARDPTNVNAQLDLATVRRNLGDAVLAGGDAPAALALFRAALAGLEPLAARDPSNADVQQAVFRTTIKLGDVASAQHDAAAALVQYRAAAANANRRAAERPDDNDVQQDVFDIEAKLGDGLLATGAAAAALASYRAALALATAIDARRPDADWDEALATGHAKVGDALRATGATAAALVEYRAALVIAAKLAASDPSSADWAANVTELRAKLAAR